MNRRIRLHRVQKCNIIDAVSDVRKQIGDILATFTVGLELPARLNNTSFVFLTSTAKGFHLNRLSIHTIHGWFIIKGIDVARAPIHEEENNAARFDGEMLRPR